MASNIDKFALRIATREKLSEFNDSDLDECKEKLIDAFGGFRRFIELGLSSPYLTILQQQELFESISDLKTETPIKNPTTTPPPILSVPSDVISNVFQFLPQFDHIQLQKTCRQFTICGRQKASYVIDPKTNKYHFGSRLKFIHFAPSFVSAMKSEDSRRQSKVIQHLQLLNNDKDEATADSLNFIMQTETVPELIKILSRRDSTFVPYQYTWSLLRELHVWGGPRCNPLDVDDHTASNMLDALIYNVTELPNPSEMLIWYLDRFTGDYDNNCNNIVMLKQQLVNSNILPFLAEKFPEGDCDSVRLMTRIIGHESFDIKDYENLQLVKRIVDVCLTENKQEAIHFVFIDYILEFIKVIHRKAGDSLIDLKDPVVIYRLLQFAAFSDDNAFKDWVKNLMRPDEFEVMLMVRDYMQCKSY